MMKKLSASSLEGKKQTKQEEARAKEKRDG